MLLPSIAAACLLFLFPNQVDARLAYLRHVAPMLMYAGGDTRGNETAADDSPQGGDASAHTGMDGLGSQESGTAHPRIGEAAPPLDPPQLLIEQLERRFLRASKGSKEDANQYGREKG